MLAFQNMSLLTSLLILIVTARLFGQIISRFNQPAIVGEMLAGLLLGPALLNLIHSNAALSGISELAVFLVVVSAGLEMNFNNVVDALGGRGIVIASIGFLVPYFSGMAIGYYFELDLMRSVFLGLCVSITALPVAVRILQSFNILDSVIAKYSVATAIFNDVVALLALGVILNLPVDASIKNIGFSVFTSIWKLLFLCLMVLGFNFMVQKVIERGIHVERIPEKIVDVLGSEALFGILVFFGLVFGSVSEAMGFHFVIGAFFGALLIDRKFFLASRYKELEHTLNSITAGFLAPVFFASLGLQFNLSAMGSVGFVSTILIVSIISKIFSGWLGSRLIGLSQVEALGIGIILNGRGVMELVIASIAFEHGFISQGLFSTLVLMGIVTTLITPFLFSKWVLPFLPVNYAASKS
jgi:Kef-type K+ transport system membrane component KefB